MNRAIIVFYQISDEFHRKTLESMHRLVLRNQTILICCSVDF